VVQPTRTARIARRQAGDYSLAREDVDDAVATDPGDHGLLFEKTMLGTVVSGPEACLERWRDLLSSTAETPADDATRFLDLRTPRLQ